jgi:hypothetical protein
VRQLVETLRYKPECPYVENFHWLHPSDRTVTLGSIPEMFPGGGGGVRWPVRRADNLTTFMCRLSRNLGASTSSNPKGLSRPVMG